MLLYIKNKVHNTKMHMQKQQTILYWLYGLCACETEDESCNILMLDDQSIDEDSVTDDM